MSGRTVREDYSPAETPEAEPPEEMQSVDQAQFIQQQQQQLQAMYQAYAMGGYGMPAPVVYGVNPHGYYVGVPGYPMPPPMGVYPPGVFAGNQLVPAFSQPDGTPDDIYADYEEQPQLVEEDAEPLPSPVWIPPQSQCSPPPQPVLPRERKVLTFFDPNTKEAVQFASGEKRVVIANADDADGGEEREEAVAE